MILEHLINGYLEGELSEEQDRELRSMLGADPAAREAFDAAVIIHIALRCEDDTQVPAHARTTVFDAIDALAAHDDHIQSRYGSQPRRSDALRRLPALVAALMLIVLVPIAEQEPFAVNSDRNYTVTTTEKGQQEVSAHAAGRMASQKGTTQTTTVLSTSSASVALNHDHDATEETSTTGSDHQLSRVPDEGNDAQPRVATPSLSSVFGSLGGGGIAVGTATPEESRPSLPEPPTTQVTVSTAFATGLTSSVEGAEAVRFIAASIGYGLGDDDVLGMEVGATQYSVQRSGMVLSMMGSGSSMTATEPPSGHGSNGKLSSPDRQAQRYASDSITYRLEESQVWGSAFYERKLFALRDVSLRSRIGAGVGEDGLIGYGRLTGEWHFGAFSLIMGAELRGMQFRTGSESGSSSATSFGSVVTALTGLYVRF